MIANEAPAEETAGGETGKPSVDGQKIIALASPKVDPRATSSTQPFTVTCTNFRPLSRNTLRGFADFNITPLGLAIAGCLIHAQGERRWASLPSKQFTGEDGIIRWKPFLEFPEPSDHWKFQQLACEAVDAFLESAGITLLDEQRPEPPLEGGHAAIKEGSSNDWPF